MEHGRRCFCRFACIRSVSAPAGSHRRSPVRDHGRDDGRHAKRNAGPPSRLCADADHAGRDDWIIHSVYIRSEGKPDG